MDTQFYTYILRCSDDTLYTGYARDLSERVAKHNQGKAAKYTRTRVPVELVYFEAHRSKNEAMSREAEIKKLSRQQKIALIEAADNDKDSNGRKKYINPEAVSKMKREDLAKKDIDINNNEQTGVLYLCGTPLGNLEDITLRVLKTLRECDLIAAEDTRRTIKLLNHFEIKTPLTSYHEHNEKFKGVKLLEELWAGKNIALVSDAGMPGISDPGEVIVRMALEKGIKVVPVPGPSAGITALVASGLATRSFVFEGFLSRDKKERHKQLHSLAGEERTILLYESPHHLRKTLRDLLEYLGDRKITLARELTKIHEEFIRGSLSEMPDQLKDSKIKGEFCLVIEGKRDDEGIKEKNLPLWEGSELQDKVQSLIKQGLSKKEAIKEVANLTGKSKREVYNEIVKLESRN